MSALANHDPFALPTTATLRDRQVVGRARDAAERAEAALASATKEQIGTRVRAVLAALPAKADATQGDATARLQGYAIGLSGVPLAGLEAAVADALQGRMGTFAPSPAELRVRADWHVRHHARQHAEALALAGEVRERVEAQRDGAWPDDAAVAERRREHAARVLAKAGFRARSIDTGDEASPERRAQAQANLVRWKAEADAGREQQQEQQEEAACAE